MSPTLRAVFYGVALACFLFEAITGRSLLAAGLASWVAVPFVDAVNAA